MTEDLTATEPSEREPEDERTPRDRIAALIDDDDLRGAVAFARELHPAELADLFGGIDREVRNLLLEHLAADEIGAALPYLEPHYRDDLLAEMTPAEIARALRQVPDDIATDAVQDLSEDLRRAVLRAMPPDLSRRISVLLTHAEHTAGGRMTGQRVAIEPHVSVRDAIQYLRETAPAPHQPFYLYTVDELGRLEGVVNLRGLLVSPPDRPVSEIADTNVISVTAATDQEEAARLLKRYRLLAMPVVDDDGRLLGAVTSDDLLDVLEDEATEDMYRIVGVDEDEDLRSVRRSVRYRLPWLTVNLGTAILAGYVISLFEGTIERAAALAAFLPVIAGMGGNAGMQTLTVVVRSLALGRVSPRNVRQVVKHELATGAVAGVAVGIALAVVGTAWRGEPLLGVVAGVALFANVLIGVTAGALIPMGLQRMDRDPALSGSIWLTTATDVLGFLVFLGLASTVVGQFD